jgi:hypothetical protein
MKKFSLPLLILLICTYFGSLEAFAQDIPPEQNNRLFSFEVANVYFEIDADFGGHISSLMLDDSEILFLDKNYGGTDYLWGSTFWHAPQNGNDGWGWPPLAALDSEPYSGGIDGNYVIIESGTDPVYELSFTKSISASSADTSITIVYTINNDGSEARSCSPWEVTRVLPSLSFFTSGEGEIIGGLADYAERIHATTWYQFNNTQNGGAKFQSDGGGNWFAHVTPDSILFIKQLENVASDGNAPGQREIELWLTSDLLYIELENQGLYESIEPGGSTDYTVKWILRKVPAGIPIEKGSQNLVNFVHKILDEQLEEVPDDIEIVHTVKQQDLFVTDQLLVIDNMSAGLKTLQIYDLTGKPVLNKQFTESRIELNMSAFSTGIYFYQIRYDSQLRAGKLIVQ